MNTNKAIKDIPLIVGTYTQNEGHVDGQAKGIYVYSFNTQTGSLTYKSTTHGFTNPSYLSTHSELDLVFAIEEVSGEKYNNSGYVSALSFDRKNNSLNKLNRVPTIGESPCYVSVTNNNCVLVANFSGSVSSHCILPNNSISESISHIQQFGSGIKPLQDSAHAHMIFQYKKQVYSVDLGADKIFIYNIDGQSHFLTQTENYINTSAGAGPRHLTFNNKTNSLYVINQLNDSIEVFNIDSNNRFERIQVISTLPQGVNQPAYSADIVIHPSGHFLYASLRGGINKIAIYQILPNNELELITHQDCMGLGPRNINIDPTGNFLLIANQDSQSIVTFRINHKTGLLFDNPSVTNSPTPVCLKFI